MSKQSLSETLQKMAADHVDRSETDRLRDVFADVEKALKSGVSRKSVLGALHQDGFTMSLKMFDKALYRIRRANRLNGVPELNAEAGNVVITPTKANIEAGPDDLSGPRKNLTRADLQKIRSEDHDWLALSQPIKQK